MPSFRYVAATGAGVRKTGTLTSASVEEVLAVLRRSGLTPLETHEISPAAEAPPTARKITQSQRRMVTRIIGELAVLLGSGLPLDRALGIAVDNLSDPADKSTLAELLARVKEGQSLSRAMMASGGLFPPMISAMAEAGEANGRLDVALGNLAETLERAETLRQTVRSALIYPVILLILAVSVILTMLVVVVPNFEGLFADGADKLPPMTRFIMAASHAVREDGVAGAIVIGLLALLAAQWLKQPSMRRQIDRMSLDLPYLGDILRNAETARFARVLGSLVDGNVPLATALGIAQRSLRNSYMAEAIGRVATGLKEGAGLTGPLAATGLFPSMAIGFLRTGEETARLGLMLERLASVLDRDVKNAIQNAIGIMTPLITIVLGGAVATIIASIITAILGFNDLAVAS